MHLRRAGELRMLCDHDFFLSYSIKQHVLVLRRRLFHFRNEVTFHWFSLPKFFFFFKLYFCVLEPTCPKYFQNFYYVCINFALERQQQKFMMPTIISLYVCLLRSSEKRSPAAHLLENVIHYFWL